MSKPIVYIVGADKGGVGKTHTTRALIDYLDSRTIPNKSFDTENEVLPSADNPTGGVLKRFYKDRTEIVDLGDSDGQMHVFDSLSPANVTVIDIKAGLLTKTIETLAMIGFLDPARFDITVFHVLGNNQASIDEIPLISGLLGPMRHVLVGNRVNDTKFTFPANALDIPMLGAKAGEAVDHSNLPFSKFVSIGGLTIDGKPSAVLAGTVNHWQGRVNAQFASAGI